MASETKCEDCSLKQPFPCDECPQCGGSMKPTGVKKPKDKK